MTRRALSNAFMLSLVAPALAETPKSVTIDLPNLPPEGKEECVGTLRFGHATKLPEYRIPAPVGMTANRLEKRAVV